MPPNACLSDEEIVERIRQLEAAGAYGAAEETTAFLWERAKEDVCRSARIDMWASLLAPRMDRNDLYQQGYLKFCDLVPWRYDPSRQARLRSFVARSLYHFYCGIVRRELGPPPDPRASLSADPGAESSHTPAAKSLRKQLSRPLSLEPVGAEVKDTRPTDPGEAIRQRELSQGVWDTLDAIKHQDSGITPDEVLIFYLWYAHRWKIKRLAEAFGCSIGTINTRHEKVRARFEQEFPRRHPEYFAAISAQNQQPVLEG